MEELTKREIQDIAENRYWRERRYKLAVGIFLFIGSMIVGAVLKDEGGLLQIPGYLLVVTGVLLIVLAGFSFYRGSQKIKKDLLEKGVIYNVKPKE